MYELDITAEVQAAFANNKPIVAQNYEMANRVEDLVRSHGATPATIAVIDGRIKIGLDQSALKTLAQTEGVRKLSRADLAICLVDGQTGATTVAATMILAHLAGINVFATGGIGGVHRGAEHSFDISADLQELAQTPVIVIAAGAKAILDIPKTLEVLETLGVPVISYGQNELPAFWSRTSGLNAPLRMDNPAQIAQAQKMRTAMGLPGGQLVANPIPADAEILQGEIEPIIDQALKESEAQGVSAKAVTPFLLQRIFELTNGRSLDSNIALVLNNAQLAAEIACAMGE
jgi:pseudouridine-5'-phosphate glycosidase